MLSEIQKEKPDLSYIRGLLEGIVEEKTITPPPDRNISLPADEVITYGNGPHTVGRIGKLTV